MPGPGVSVANYESGSIAEGRRCAAENKRRRGKRDRGNERGKKEWSLEDEAHRINRAKRERREAAISAAGRGTRRTEGGAAREKGEEGVGAQGNEGCNREIGQSRENNDFSFVVPFVKPRRAGFTNAGRKEERKGGKDRVGRGTREEDREKRRRKRQDRSRVEGGRVTSEMGKK